MRPPILVLGGWYFDITAAMGLNNRFDNRKAHSCALNAISLALSTIKLVKDHGPFQIVNAGATVRHAGDKAVVLNLAGDER